MLAFPLSLWQPPEPVSLWEIVIAFFNSNVQAFTVALESPNRNLLVLQIVALAGFSEAIGQCVALFANRVSPLRFVMSLGVSVVFFILGYLVWVVSLWLVADWIFNRHVSLWLAGAAVGLSYIPLIFSFLALMPYFGYPVLRLLNVWAAVALVNILRFSFEFEVWQAVLCAAIGLGIIFALRLTIGKPVLWLMRRLRNAAAGKPLQLDLAKIFYSNEANDEE
ncbi:MAG: hypothetical protein KDJ97_37280 [Anaerolineae bacterium]|nr:hypothetical protein [Anaerolineae bacterium]